MRADLPLTAEEHAWRAKHGVMLPTERRMLNRRARRLLSTVRYGAIPPGPHGFDVSSYQPAGPNFRAGGRTFGIFKATESTSYFDPHFSANRGAAHAQGCSAVGIYHFARPGSTDPVSQAHYFLSHVGARQPGEFAVLDYEVPPFDPNWAAAYINTLQQAGWHCAFYTYAGMAAANPTAAIRQATPFYWPAGYSSNPPSADRWADVGWTLWQHTDGQYGVVDGPWDCSVANPTLLLQLAQASAPVPVPVPTPTPPPEDLDDLFTNTIVLQEV